MGVETDGLWLCSVVHDGRTLGDKYCLNFTLGVWCCQAGVELDTTLVQGDLSSVFDEVNAGEHERAAASAV